MGVVRGASDVIGRSDAAVYGTPAFDREYRGRVAYANRILARTTRRRGTPPSSSTTPSVEQWYPDSGSARSTPTTRIRPAERTTHTLAVGLSVFALIAALVSVLVVNQAVVRHVNGTEADHPALNGARPDTRAARSRGVVAIVAPAAAAAAASSPYWRATRRRR